MNWGVSWGIKADLDGKTTGNFTYRETDGDPYIFSDLQVDTLRFNDQLIGPTKLKASLERFKEDHSDDPGIEPEQQADH